MAKMWAGRTDGVTDKIADDFNSSIRFDSRMYRQDITGSMAHAAMLAAKHIITNEDAGVIHTVVPDAVGGFLVPVVAQEHAAGGLGIGADDDLAVDTVGNGIAVGIHNMRGGAKKTITFLNNVPMINPDIITGVSLFLLFVFFKNFFYSFFFCRVDFIKNFLSLNWNENTFFVIENFL